MSYYENIQTMFKDGIHPNLDDGTLKKIEDFLILAADNQIREYLPIIFDFFCQHLQKFLTEDSTNEYFQYEILQMVKLIKPVHLTEHLETFCKILFRYLYVKGKVKRIALAMLSNCITCLPVEGNSYLINREFHNWCYDYIKQCSENIFEIETRTFFLVFLVFSTPLPDKKLLCVKYIPLLLDIVYKCLYNMNNPDFFMKCETIACKTLNFLSKICEYVHQNDRHDIINCFISMMNTIDRIREMIPFDIKFYKIYADNIIFTLSLLVQRRNHVLEHYVKANLFDNGSIAKFGFEPLSKSYRVGNILNYLYQCIQIGIFREGVNLLDHFFPLLASTSMSITNIRYTQKIIQQLIIIEESARESDRDLYISTIASHLDHYFSIWDVVITDFRDSMGQYSLINRTIIMEDILKLIERLGQDKVNTRDQDHKYVKFYYIRKFLSNVVRLHDIIDAVLFYCGDKKRTPQELAQLEKVIPLDDGIKGFYSEAKSFLGGLSTIKRRLEYLFKSFQEFGEQTEVYFLESEIPRLFPKFYNTLLIPRILYFLYEVTSQKGAFISFLLKNLIYSHRRFAYSPENLLSTLHKIFSSQFSKSQQQPHQSISIDNSLNAYKIQINRYLFEFILLSISRQDKNLIDNCVVVLLKVLLSYKDGLPKNNQMQSNNFFEDFFALLKNKSVNWALLFFSLNRQHKGIYSRLALFLFPFCYDPDDKSPVIIDLWFRSFLPVIESCYDLSESDIDDQSKPVYYTDIYKFFSFISQSFQSFTEPFRKLNQDVQKSYINAFVTKLSKPHIKKPDRDAIIEMLYSVKDLVNRNVSSIVKKEKDYNLHKDLFYDFNDGRRINVDIFFREAKRNDNLGSEFWSECFVYMVKNLSFTEFIKSQTLEDLAVYFAKNRRQVIESLPYSNISHYLRFRFFYKSDLELDDYPRFLNQLVQLLYLKDRYESALKVAHIIIDKVPFDNQTLYTFNYAIINCGNVSELSYGFIKRHILDLDEQDKRGSQVISHFYSILHNSYLNNRNKNAKRIIYHCIKICESKEITKSVSNEKKNSVVQHILKQSMRYPNKTLFIHCFYAFRNAIALYGQFFDYIKKNLERLSNDKPLFIHSRYEQYFKDFLYKNNEYIMRTDYNRNIYEYLNVKFFLRAIAVIIAIDNDCNRKCSRLREVLNCLEARNLRPFLSYFIRSLDKSVKRAHVPYSSFNRELMSPIKEYDRPMKFDLRRLMFSVKCGNYLHISEVYKLLFHYLNKIKESYSSDKRNHIYKTVTIIFEIFAETKTVTARYKEVEGRYPEHFMRFLRDTINLYCEVMIRDASIYSLVFPIHLPLYLIIEAFPDEYVQCFKELILERRSLSLCLYFEQLFKNPRLQKFAYSTFTMLKENMSSILSEVSKTERYRNLYFIAFAALSSVIHITPFEKVQIHDIYNTVFQHFAAKNIVPGSFYRLSCLNILFPTSHSSSQDLFSLLSISGIKYLISRSTFNHPSLSRRAVESVRRYGEKKTIFIQDIVKLLDIQNVLDHSYLYYMVYSILSGIYHVYKQKDHLEKIQVCTSHTKDASMFGWLVNEYNLAKFCLIPEVNFTDYASLPAFHLVTELRYHIMKNGTQFPEPYSIGSAIRTISNKSIDKATAENIIIDITTEIPLFLDALNFRLFEVFNTNPHLDFTNRFYGRHFIGFLNIKGSNIEHYFKYVRQLHCRIDSKYQSIIFNMFLEYFKASYNVREKIGTLLSLVPVISSLRKDTKYFSGIMNKDIVEILETEPNDELLVIFSALTPYFARYLEPGVPKFLKTTLNAILSGKPIQSSQVLDSLKRVLRDFFRLRNHVFESQFMQIILSYQHKRGQTIFKRRGGSSVFVNLLRIGHELGKSLDHSVKLFPIFIEAFEPLTIRDFVRDLAQCKIPLSKHDMPFFTNCMKRLNIRSLHTKDYPILHYFFPPKFGDLINASWKYSWASQNPDTHIFLFIAMLHPDLRSLVYNFSIEQAMYVVFSSVSRILPNLEKFIVFYTSVFKGNSLSEAFYMTGIFSSHEPKPHMSLSHNMDFLLSMSLPDDSLGLTKTKIKNLHHPASVHQLSSYELAKYFYIDTADKYPETFGASIKNLNSLIFNMDYVGKMRMSKEFTKECLFPNPVTLLHTRESDVNELFHRHSLPNSSFAYPLLSSVQMVMVIVDLIKHQKSLSLPPENLLQSLIQYKFVQMNRIDKLNIFSMSLGLRNFALSTPNLSKFSESKELEQYFMSVHLTSLAYSGCIRKAIKMYVDLIRSEHSKPLASHRSLGDIVDYIKRPFPINNNTFRRVYTRLIRENSSNSPSLMGTIANIEHHLHCIEPQVRNVRKDIDSSVHQIIRLLDIIFCYYNKCISNENLLKIVFDKLFFSSRLDIEKKNQVILLVLAHCRADENFRGMFFSRIREFLKNPQEKDRKRSLLQHFVRYTPLLFSIFLEPPTELIQELILFAHNYVLIHIKNAELSSINPRYIRNEVRSFINSNANVKRFFDMSEKFHGWANNEVFRPALQKFHESCCAHRRLAYMLSRGEFEVDENERRLFNGDIIKYCEDNPPFIKLDTRIKEYIFANQETYTDYNFILSSTSSSEKDGPVVAYDVYAPGDRDGVVVFTTQEGEKISYSIVSPIMYNIRVSDDFVLVALSKIFNEHPASVNRNTFVPQQNYYYYVNNDILLIKGGLFGLYTCLKSKYLTSLYRNTKDKPLVPAVIKAAKNIDLPKHNLYNLLVDNSKGKLVDFIYFRQTLGSNIGLLTAIKFLLKGTISRLPNMGIVLPNSCVISPGLSHFDNYLTYLPLSNQIKELLPSYILHGSLSSTWQIAMNSIINNPERIKICLSACLPPIKNNSDILSRIVDRFFYRAKLSAFQYSEDTEKYSDPFCFAVVNHLIKVSNNCYNSRPELLSWF